MKKQQKGYSVDTVKMAPPWVTFARKINVLFAEDPEIKVNYNNDDISVTLLVDNPTKADALSKILPETKDFGNVTLKITVVPANSNDSKIALFRKAFAGNPIVSYMEDAESPFSNPICYMAFENEVVQFFDDKLDDPYGLESTLAEDIARDIFDDTEGVLFCTDLPKALGLSSAPLGEWP